MEPVALVIAPHPDDAEIGMGGSIAALISQGVRVVLADLTDGEPTPHGSPALRAQETAEASRILGVLERRNLGLKNRELFDSVENRTAVANLIREVRPTVLFAPYWEDAHPDHVEASKLVDSARFYSKFVKGDLLHQPWYPRKQFYFFSTHLKVRFIPTFIVDISNHLETKMKALSAYHSQFIANERSAHRLDEIRREATYWGDQVGAHAGEPFVSRDSIRVDAKQMLFSL